MSNIEHLFENALSWLENGWNMSQFAADKVNHELLSYVDASAEEIIAMARYVFDTRCAWCDEKRVIKCDDCEKCGDETECWNRTTNEQDLRCLDCGSEMLREM